MCKLVIPLFIVMLVFCMPVSAVATEQAASIQPFKNQSFSPARNEVFIFHVKASASLNIKEIKVKIITSDNDLIRVLLPIKNKENTNSYEFSWDGRDTERGVVPDEVYHPVINILTADNVTHTISSHTSSGGEEVYGFEKHIRPGAIEYTLPVASRVLIRTGIKNGPMLRTLIDWQPRTSGFHVERWNGRDLDDLIAVEQNPKVGHLIVGYQLPDNSIITYGNNSETYRTYHERKNWPLKQATYENNLLERNGTTIRPEYYQPVLQQKSPRIEAVFLTKQSRQPTKSVQGFDEFITEVKLHPLDEMYLDQERYEISFFINNDFIAEEEQGFVPFTWRWSPGRQGIKPGKHILTVNISGYAGQVGVRNIPFTLLDEKKILPNKSREGEIK